MIPVSYVFQKLEDLPAGYSLPEERVKPWGTAQAVWACRNEVSGNFVMINSDDFYGKTAYEKIKEFFDNLNDDKTYTMVGFRVINTMTENGSVKRGVCEEENGYLTNIIESKIEKVDGKIIASPLSGKESFEVDGNDLVSMNFFGFTDKIFSKLESGFKEFLDNNKDDLLTCEYLIPDVVFEEIRNDKKMVVLESFDKWLGVTYKEDKEDVVKVDETIKNLFKDKKEFKKKIEDYFDTFTYNHGTAAEKGAKYILQSLIEKKKNKKEN
jgi:hypothetical protein